MKQILVPVDDKDFDTYVVMQYYKLSDVEKVQYLYTNHPFNDPKGYKATEIESVIFIGVTHRMMVDDLGLYKRLQEEGIAVTVIGRYIDINKSAGIANFTGTLITADQSKEVKPTMTSLVANYYSDNIFDNVVTMKLARNLVEIYYNRKEGFYTDIAYSPMLPYAIGNYLNVRYNPDYTLEKLLSPFWGDYYIPQLKLFNKALKHMDIKTTVRVQDLDNPNESKELNFNVLTGDFRDTDWITGISDLANSSIPLIYIQYSSQKVEARIYTMNSGMDVLKMAKELFPVSEVPYVGGSKNVAYILLSKDTKYINDTVFFRIND